MIKNKSQTWTWFELYCLFRLYETFEWKNIFHKNESKMEDAAWWGHMSLVVSADSLAGPWSHHVTLHRCPSSNIGQPQASASGQANIISSQTFSRLSHKTHQKQYAQKIRVKTVRKILSRRSIDGLPGLAAILRHLAASGESGLVTSG